MFQSQDVGEHNLFQYCKDILWLNGPHCQASLLNPYPLPKLSLSLPKTHFPVSFPQVCHLSAFLKYTTQRLFVSEHQGGSTESNLLPGAAAGLTLGDHKPFSRLFHPHTYTHILPLSIFISSLVPLSPSPCAHFSFPFTSTALENQPPSTASTLFFQTRACNQTNLIKKPIDETLRFQSRSRGGGGGGIKGKRGEEVSSEGPCSPV